MPPGRQPPTDQDVLDVLRQAWTFQDVQLPKDLPKLIQGGLVRFWAETQRGPLVQALARLLRGTVPDGVLTPEAHALAVSQVDRLLEGAVPLWHSQKELLANDVIEALTRRAEDHSEDEQDDPSDDDHGDDGEDSEDAKVPIADRPPRGTPPVAGESIILVNLSDDEHALP